MKRRKKSTREIHEYIVPCKHPQEYSLKKRLTARPAAQLPRHLPHDPNQLVKQLPVDKTQRLRLSVLTPPVRILFINENYKTQKREKKEKCWVCRILVRFCSETEGYDI